MHREMNTSDDLSLYLTGDKLYGDYFDEQQIASWYRDEAEAYADLGAGDLRQYHLSPDVIQHPLPSHQHAEQNRPFLRILGA